MKKKIVVFISLVICFLLCACTSKQKKDNEMYVYYLNTDKNALIKEIYPIQDVSEILKKLEVHGVLSADVKVGGFRLYNGNLELYFDTNYFLLEKSEEVLTRAAIVRTLVQVEGVDSVSFYIGQDPLTDGKGQAVGMMKAEDFVDNTGASVAAYQTADLILYFSDTEGTGLKEKEMKNVRYNANSSIERVIIEQLMNGTSSLGTRSTIPKSTTLLGVSVKENICYVNFDSKFVTDSYDLNPEVAIYSIVNSLIANGTVSQVQILIDGSSNVVYKNSVNLNRPLVGKAQLIKE